MWARRAEHCFYNPKTMKLYVAANRNYDSLFQPLAGLAGSLMPGVGARLQRNSALQNQMFKQLPTLEPQIGHNQNAYLYKHFNTHLLAVVLAALAPHRTLAG